jgi:RNA-binding protein with serine-rich domain 1
MDRTHPELGRGYGFVEYDKPEDAEKALKHMDGGQIDGMEIQCELTLPYRDSRGGGGRSPPRYRSPPRRRASPPRSSGANRIPIGGAGGGGRFRSRSRSPRR